MFARLDPCSRATRGFLGSCPHPPIMTGGYYNLAGRVGPGHTVVGNFTGRVGSGRVGPGRVGSGRVGSGRVGSGRVGSGRVGSGQAWRVLDLAGREGVTLARPDP